MASGYFSISEPGLAYAQRGSYRADPRNLPADPQNAASPIAGEWVALVNGLLTRISDNPGTPTGSVAATAALAFPLLIDKARTDTQSSAVAGVSTTDGPGMALTVLKHTGASCTTSLFATKHNTGVDIPYAVGDDLVLATFRDEYGNVRCGLSRSAAAGVVAVPGSVLEGEVKTLGTTVVAKLERTGYSLTGVAVGAGRTFPSTRQVIDIIIK